MSKSELRELAKATQYVAWGHHDIAARTLATVHRSARSHATQTAVLERVKALGLTDRVAIVNGCMVHIELAQAVRS